jgi:hypothetical protein
MAMKPGKVIESLLAVGVATKRAYGLARARNGVDDWAKFVKSKEFAAANRGVAALLKELKPRDIDAALKAVRKKQHDFLDGRSIGKLSSAELMQFNDLADVEVALVNRKLRKLDRTAEFYESLVEEVLPVLIRTASTVIKLLL